MSLKNLADLALVYKNKGIYEIAGPASHPQIKEWIKKTEQVWPTDLPVDDSRYSWCGVFVGNMVWERNKDQSPKTLRREHEPPKYFQRAKAWLEFGQVILKDKGEKGDVLVCSRGQGLYHVTIIKQRTDQGYVCVGGNQSDAVTETLYRWNKVVGVRRPLND